MIREITKYPNPPTVEFAVDVRVFDEELFSFIDDLKDTIDEYNLDGLASTQVGSYYSVAVVKDADRYLELINPRILNTKGKITSVEKTAYYGDSSVEITRYDQISLVYEDRDAVQHSLRVSGDLSVLIQRKIDYLFGANFLTKLSAEDRSKFEADLNADKSQSCPTTKASSFSRDWFVHAGNYMMIAMLVPLGLSLFLSDSSELESLWQYQLYMSFVVLGINIAYTLYSYYENRRFNICSSCYNMSIFGVVFVGLFRLSMLMAVSYFLVKP